MTRTEYVFSVRENIANNIQHHRYQLGLTQAVFSEHLGISENRAYLLENPKRGGTTINSLATIAYVLGTTVADLVATHEGRTRLRGRAAQQRPRSPLA